MSATMEPIALRAALMSHFARRADGFFDVATGPTNERWFTQESIVALRQAQPPNLNAGLAVAGEWSYSKLKELDAGAVASRSARRPDVFAYSYAANAIVMLAEAKAVYTDTADGVFFDAIEELRIQLDRAKQRYPDAVVLGLVFAVHCLGNCVGDKLNLAIDDEDYKPDDRTWEEMDQDEASACRAEIEPQDFYDRVADSIEASLPFPPCQWADGRVGQVPGVEKINPVGGIYNGAVSLGLGVIQLV